jgi:ATP-binding cassette subfamily B protein
MLKAFLAYYRPYRTLFLVDFGCAILSGLLEPIGHHHHQPGIGDVEQRQARGGEQDQAPVLPRQDWSLILLAAAGLALLYVANAGLMVVVTYWATGWRSRNRRGTGSGTAGNRRGRP